MKSTPDLFVKGILVAIALLLAAIAMRPYFEPRPVLADSDGSGYFIEPGTTVIRRPDGSSPGEGKIVIDLRNGEVWGFPTNLAGAPYPVATVAGRPGVSRPVYLGRFEFQEMRRGR